MFKYNSDTYNRYGYLSILIFPLSTLYLSLRDFRQPQARNLFWFFCVFLGMIHIYNPAGGTTSDGADYANELTVLHDQHLTWEQYSARFSEEEGKTIDFYQPVVTFFVSQMTSNAHILFAFYAFVFGFFYSRNVWTVLNFVNTKMNLTLFLILASLFLVCPIWSINGVRMWTAMHVFVYGALPLFINGDRTKIVWCFLASIVHFSFMIPLALLLALVFFIPKNLHFLFVIYCITLFINSLNLDAVKDQLTSYLPSFMVPRVETYVDADYAASRSVALMDKNMISVMSAFISTNYVKVCMILIYIKGQNAIKSDTVLRNLYQLSLVFLSFSNVSSLIPSGNRFATLSNFFFFAMLTYYAISEKDPKTLNLFGKVALFLFIPLLLNLRIGTDYYGISLIISNPVTCWLFTDDVVIIQFIKSLF